MATPRKYCGFAGLASKSRNDKNQASPPKSKAQIQAKFKVKADKFTLCFKNKPEIQALPQKAKIHALTPNNKAQIQALTLKTLIKAALSKALIAVKASFKAPVFACFAEFLLQDIAAVIDK